MIRILIFDDDYFWQNKIELILSEYTQFEIVGFAESVSKAQLMVDSLNPDILISDLFLGSDSVLSHLESVFSRLPTLFLTSEQSKDTFLTVLNYPLSSFLVKPFHVSCFMSSLFSLTKHCFKILEESKYLTFRGFKSGIHKVKFADIVKIEVEGNYCVIFTSAGKRYARKISLTAILKSLDDRFVRISKTTVVNQSFLTRVDYFDKMVYIDKEVYHIGRPYVKKLKSNSIIL